MTWAWRSEGYTLDQVNRAELIARTAHIHHVRAGLPPEPYEAHLRRCARRFGPGPARCVAWLHDSVEDTSLEFIDLATLGVDKDVVAAVSRLTHPHSVTFDQYMVYIQNIADADDKIADVVRAVKLADLKDNLGAIDRLTREGRTGVAEKLRKRYGAALEVLA